MGQFNPLEARTRIQQRDASLGVPCQRRQRAQGDGNTTEAAADQRTRRNQQEMLPPDMGLTEGGGVPGK